jgi:hypothetical protein
VFRRGRRADAVKDLSDDVRKVRARRVRGDARRAVGRMVIERVHARDD